MLGNVTLEGKLEIDRAQLAADVKRFMGKEVLLTIDTIRKTRDLSDNAYYFAVVVPSMLDAVIGAGYDEWELMDGKQALKEMHEYLKKEHLRNHKVVRNPKGDEMTLPPSTTRCDEIEFKKYIKIVKEFAREYLNYTIPDKERKTPEFGWFPENERN